MENVDHAPYPLGQFPPHTSVPEKGKGERMANLDSTNDDNVCSVLWEADELLSADSADLSDDLKGALLKRLIVLPQCTDSGVALCQIARVWTQLGLS